MHKIKKYLRLIVACGVGLGMLTLSTALIRFLETWLPANGFNISNKVFTITSIGALSVVLSIGAKLCIKTVTKIEANKEN